MPRREPRRQRAINPQLPQNMLSVLCSCFRHTQREKERDRERQRQGPTSPFQSTTLPSSLPPLYLHSYSLPFHSNHTSTFPPLNSPLFLIFPTTKRFTFFAAFHFIYTHFYFTSIFFPFYNSTPLSHFTPDFYFPPFHSCNSIIWLLFFYHLNIQLSFFFIRSTNCCFFVDTPFCFCCSSPSELSISGFYWALIELGICKICGAICLWKKVLIFVVDQPELPVWIRSG